jgi:hypothetical protein
MKLYIFIKTIQYLPCMKMEGQKLLVTKVVIMRMKRSLRVVIRAMMVVEMTVQIKKKIRTEPKIKNI